MAAYITLGTDSSGRPIRMSPRLHAVWEQVCAVLGFAPTIVQGGWLTNAAAASATTHAGDALDLRTRDLTDAQVQATIRVLRAHSIAAWLRDHRHGMDPHIHAIPGRWANPSPSALRQWDACRAGRDGLASNGPDYHAYPLAQQPPEDDMAQYADQLDRIERKIDAARERDRRRQQVLVKRLRAILAEVKDDATKDQIRRVRADISALADDLAADEATEDA